MKRTHLLILGAGPYGLATAAYAKHMGMDFLILGKLMDFWTAHMPKGMLLRSGADWHLDAQNVYTFEAFLKARGLKKEDTDPIPLDLFRQYGCWFADQVNLHIRSSMAREIQPDEQGFLISLEDGSEILAENVLVTPGFQPFMNVPEELAQIIPHGRYVHTCESVEFESLRGKRCLIIGGRQSAFESAALINEMDAEEIYLVYRHGTPRFEASEWAWIDPMMDLTSNIRGWYRHLPADERAAIERRFWKEGRLKLEPWLAPRIHKSAIKLVPNVSLSECREQDDGRMSARLSDGQVLVVDHIILATGYRVNIAKVPYLAHESIASNLKINEGFPVLDEDFQSSIPGLFMTGLVAAKDFGPFFGFAKGCPTAAKIIVHGVMNRLNG